MSDNVPLNPGTGGLTAAAREITHGGDTTQLQGVFLMGITGSEGSYTAGAINGDATNGIDVDVTRVNFSGNVDTAAGATQIGVAALTVRDDALATLTEADGDLSLARVNARGALWVALDSTVAQNVTLAAETTKVIGTVNVAASQTIGLAAGAATIGALTANQSVNVAQINGVTTLMGNGASGTGVQRVTIASDSTGILAAVTNVATIGTSVTPGTSAAHLGKAEDAVHSSGDTGVLALGVRQDADTSPVSASGDYQAFMFDANGYLKVNIKAGAGSGGTALADAAAFTRGTTSATPFAGVVETAAPTLTNGNTGTVSLTTGGALRVAVASGGISGVTEDAVASGTAEGVLAVVSRKDTLATLTPADGDYVGQRVNARGALWVALDSTAAQNVTLAAGSATIGALTANQSVNVAQINGVTTLMGNGASGTGAQRVTIANDSTGILAAVTNVATIGTSVTPGTAAANLGKAEDAAHTTGDTGVMALGVRADTLATTANATGDYVPFLTDSVGAVWVRDSATQVDDAAFTPATSRILPIGFQADETGTDSVDEGDGGCPRMTLDRKVIVTPQAHTAGGATPVSVVSAASTNATSLKGSAGQVYSVTATNVNAAMRYLKFYNKATAPTVGTDVPVYVFPLPGNTAGGGVTHSFSVGLEFTTGIAWALTTGAAVTDTGAVSVSEHIVSIGYK